MMVCQGDVTHLPAPGVAPAPRKPGDGLRQEDGLRQGGVTHLMASDF